MHGAHRAQLGHADLEIAQHFEQERLEGGVGAINLINQQHHRIGRGQRQQQRSRQQKAFGEKDIIFDGQAIRGLDQRLGVGQEVGELVAQKLGVEHLLGVFPFVQRLGLIKPFVALQADEAAAAGAGPGFRQFGLTDASRPFGQHGLAQLLGKVEDRGNGVRSDVTLLAQLSADSGWIFEHEFLTHG